MVIQTGLPAGDLPLIRIVPPVQNNPGLLATIRQHPPVVVKVARYTYEPRHPPPFQWNQYSRPAPTARSAAQRMPPEGGQGGPAAAAPALGYLDAAPGGDRRPPRKILVAGQSPQRGAQQ